MMMFKRTSQLLVFGLRYLLSPQALFALILNWGVIKNVESIKGLDNNLIITKSLYLLALALYAYLIVVKNRGQYLYKNLFLYSYTIFFAWCSLYFLFFGFEHAESDRKYFQLLVIVTHACVAPWILFTTRVEVERFMKLFVLMGLAATIPALWENIVHGEATTGAFGSQSYQQLGRVAGASLLMAVPFAFSRGSMLISVFWSWCLLLLLLGVILSGARQGIFGVIIAISYMFILVIYKTRLDRKTSFVGFFVASVTALVVLATLASVGWNLNIVHVRDRLPYLSVNSAGSVKSLSSSSTTTSPEPSTDTTRNLSRLSPSQWDIKHSDVWKLLEKSERIQLWSDAVPVLIDHPVKGVGFGRYLELNSSRISSPHNIFLEILVEMGLVGLILWLLLIYQPARLVCKANIASKDMVSVALGGTWIYWLVCACMSGSLGSLSDFMMISSSLLIWEGIKNPH